MTAQNSIAIDARPFAGPPNGYTTYLSSIIQSLLEGGFAITLLANRPLDSRYELVKHCQVEIFGPLGAWRWEQIALPKYLRQHDFDLYFAGANRAIPWRRQKSTKHILGLLDVIPYKFPALYIWKWPFHFVRHELAAQLVAIWRADDIITISSSSAHDIQKTFGRHATPLLIKLGVAELKSTSAPQKQFVYVGGVDPRKKIDNLLRGFAKFSSDHDDYELILIGRGYEVFNNLIRELDLQKKVVLAGVIDDAAKHKTISQSTALVYPSLYEGYGLAIAEAILADVPVIAGSGGAQKEIGGEVALYIDPLDPNDIALAMNKILDPAVRQTLAEARQKQQKILTSQQITKDTVDYFINQVGAK